MVVLLRFCEVAFVVLLALIDDVPVSITKDQQLVFAAFNLDFEKVQKLLKEGSSPNSRLLISNEELFFQNTGLQPPLGSNQWTPLLAVSQSQLTETEALPVESIAEHRKRKKRNESRISIAKLLVEAEAELNVDDGFGATPLYNAVCGGDLELVRYLVASGARVDTETKTYIDNPSGRTPLHMSVATPIILKELLKAGANVNLRESRGMTALHYAVCGGHIESVQFLLTAGADPQICDLEGYTPSGWCKRFELNLELKDPKSKELADRLQKRLNVITGIDYAEIAKLLQAAERDTVKKKDF